ncbi:MAG TPA: hypothetical protein VMX13_10095 [Sedimentisphaerales bacterium]|nr:hypothetical protein [Sedimentisphaerales bacterium]
MHPTEKPRVTVKTVEGGESHLPASICRKMIVSTGGHSPRDAKNNMIWSVRLRVRSDRSGIELLPVDSIRETTDRKEPQQRPEL